MLDVQMPLEAVPDGLVLRRFIERREEDAFAELVRRHGPLVRAACKRALGASPDADDAFQAVFLILSRKAAALRNVDLLGPWLHTVAVRAASRVRKAARRRHSRERQVASMPEPAVEPPEPTDWLAVLDAEIQRLPEHLRVPLVLCELEGKSRAVASRLLGLNAGTLSSRLARGRELLRRRLQRTGMVAAEAGLTVAFAFCSEAVPAPLLANTIQAVLSGATSASVGAIAQGVVKAMLFAKLKTSALIILTLAILTGLPLAAGYTVIGAANGRAQDAKTDNEKLQGMWELISAQSGGKEAEGRDAEQMKMLKFSIKGDKLIAKTEAGYTLDPSKKPKEIDLLVADGPEQERGTWKGIYELMGDELTLCMALPNHERPTQFVSNEGEMTMLLKLKRAK
jgi:RNA polymerase sigma factor (sigma-70 family)